MVSDEQAIANLVLSYAERVDAGDFDGVGALFVDATYRIAVGQDVLVVGGAADVAAQMRSYVQVHEDGTPRTRHQTTNLIIDIDGGGDTATCRSSYCVLPVVMGQLQPIIVGRYHDELAKVDGRWRFADRIVFTDLAGDLRGHLRRELPT